MGGAVDPDEGLAAWWARKRAELDYLATFAADPPPLLPVEPPGDPVARLLDAARAMRRALRLTATERIAGLFETAQEVPWEPAHEVAGAHISYHYQRYDLVRTTADWLALIHAREAPGRAGGGMLMGSGMGAITAVLAAMGRLGMASISISPWCYFETHLLLDTYVRGIRLTVSDGPALDPTAEVAWLDTSSTRWPAFPTERGALRMLVVDSSCVEAGSDMVDDWLEAGRRLRVPVVLVRSHLKLDTFGVELGRLGSVVVVAPDDDPEAIAPLLTAIRQATAWMGLGFELTNLHPWLGEPTFVALSAARTAGIRATSARIADAIDAARQPGDRYQIIRPRHGLFMLIRTGIPFFDPDTWKLHEASYGLATELAAEGLPVFAGSSFGMDRVSLSQFVDVRDDAHYLRVTGADLPQGSLPGIGVRVRDSIARLTARELALGGRAVEG